MSTMDNQTPLPCVLQYEAGLAVAEGKLQEADAAFKAKVLSHLPNCSLCADTAIGSPAICRNQNLAIFSSNIGLT